MIVKKDWPKLIAIAIFFTLLGGYYDRLAVETRTFIIPVLIFVAAAFVLGRLKQLQYEMRSSRVTTLEIVTQQLSLADVEGNERVSISAASDSSGMIFYDGNHEARATLELLDSTPVLKLMGEKGSAVLTFNDDGSPNFTLRGEMDEVIWSAP
jgi:hypothetical protein